MGLNGWAGGAGTFAAFHQDVTNVVAGNTYALSFWQEGDGGWNGSDVTGTVSIQGGTTLVVTTRDTYDTKFLSIVGLGSMTVSGRAEARIIRSVGGVEQ